MTTATLRETEPLRILVAGPARTGTTWVGEGIAAGTLAAYVGEPDHPQTDPLGAFASRAVGFYPLLRPGETAPDYELLWDHAFEGGWTFPRRPFVRRSLMRSRMVAETGVPMLAGLHMRLRPAKRRVVVKSVFGANSVEWVADHYKPGVVLVRRNILNVVASWKKLNWMVWFGAFGLPTVDQLQQRFPELADVPPVPEGGTIGAIAWWIAVQLVVQDAILPRHSDWALVDHDKLCVDPEAGFREILTKLNLPWSAEMAAFLNTSDADSVGDFATRRPTRDQPDNWKHGLTSAEVEEVRRALEGFPASYLGA